MFPVTDNTGSTALITGASSGIGEAFALLLAQRGCSLVLVSENEPELKRVKARIGSLYPVSVRIIQADLCRTESADRLFGTCSEEGIEVDLLINGAGIYVNAEIELADPDRVRDELALHVQSLTRLCLLFGRAMIERCGGSILNISSISAFFPDFSSLTYGPSKDYVLKLSEALHCDWKEHNIRVTCLVPGGVRSNFFKTNRIYVPPMVTSHLMSAERCAGIGLRALSKGKMRVIPGVLAKLHMLLFRFTTKPAFYSFYKRLYFRM